MSTTTFRYQVLFYLICGAISTSFDFALYKVLLHHNTQMDIAKAISFLTATFISYFLNKHITFRTKYKSFSEFLNFIFVHIVSVCIDVGANRLFFILLGLFIEGKYRIEFSFLFATFCSVSINFLGQKFWVFKRVK